MLAETFAILLKGLILILFSMGAAAYMTFLERIIMARIQIRLGPTRVGPLGLLQPIADGIKLLTKERFQPLACRHINLLAGACHFSFSSLYLSLF